MRNEQLNHQFQPNNYFQESNHYSYIQPYISFGNNRGDHQLNNKNHDNNNKNEYGQHESMKFYKSDQSHSSEYSTPANRRQNIVEDIRMPTQTYYKYGNNKPITTIPYPPKGTSINKDYFNLTNNVGYTYQQPSNHHHTNHPNKNQNRHHQQKKDILRQQQQESYRKKQFKPLRRTEETERNQEDQSKYYQVYDNLQIQSLPNEREQNFVKTCRWNHDVQYNIEEDDGSHVKNKFGGRWC